MNRLKRAAVLAQLADRLREKGSWCGETHLQKSTYLLQELLHVPTEFNFILYKFGPYSFDLSDELTSLRADEILQLQVRASETGRKEYGPTFCTTLPSIELRKRYPVTLKKYSDQIEFVAAQVGDKGVTELERLATALYVTLKNPELMSVSDRAQLLIKLKPHVSLDAAGDAIRTLDLMTRSAEKIRIEPEESDLREKQCE